MGGEKKKIKPRVQERLPGILAITEVDDFLDRFPLSRISKKQRRVSHPPPIFHHY